MSNERSGLLASEMDALFQERMLERPLSASCGLCAWTEEGTAGDVLELARAHRREHGFRKTKVSRRRIRNLRSFKAHALTAEDEREIAEEIARRARENGVEVVSA